MSNDNYQILNLDSDPLVLGCKNKAAIDKFFNKNQDLQDLRDRNISVTIPNGVTEIGEEAFYDCSSLTSINIPDGVTRIGDDPFADCLSLEELVIPDDLFDEVMGNRKKIWSKSSG